MNTVIAQTQAKEPVSLPQSPQLMEGSIMAAIAFFVIKESIAFFKGKDASEEKLTQTLIEDLRSDRTSQLRQQGEMIAQLKSSHDKIAAAIERMSQATTDINTALQMSKRTETEIFHAIRQNYESIASLNKKLDLLLTPAQRALNNGIQINRTNEYSER